MEKLLRLAVLWLLVSGVILWHLHQQEQVGQAETTAMIAGALTLGAFATGLLVAGFRALVGR